MADPPSPVTPKKTLSTVPPGHWAADPFVEMPAVVSCVEPLPPRGAGPLKFCHAWNRTW